MKNGKWWYAITVGAALALTACGGKSGDATGGPPLVRGAYSADVAVSVGIENALGLSGPENCVQRFTYTQGGTTMERLDFFGTGCLVPSAALPEYTRKASVRLKTGVGGITYLVGDDGSTVLGKGGTDPGTGLFIVSEMCNVNGAAYPCRVSTDGAAAGSAHWQSIAPN